MNQQVNNLLLSGATRHICVRFPNGEYPDITSGVHSDSLLLSRILNKESELNFGECNSSRFEMRVDNVSDVSGLKILAYMKITGYSAEIPLFTGYVDSAKIEKDYRSRTITAYDELYKVSQVDVTEWYEYIFGRTEKADYKGVWSAQKAYNSGEIVEYAGNYYRYAYSENSYISVGGIKESSKVALIGKNPEELRDDSDLSAYIQQLSAYLPYTFGKITVKQFRDSLFNLVGIRQETISLINDNELITHSIKANSITFGDCIKAICQLNAVFGNVSSDGTFQYISLGSSEIDYTGNIREADTSSEEQEVTQISRVDISGHGGNVSSDGTDTNPWILKDNFLLSGLEDNQLKTIANRLFQKVKNYRYTAATTRPIISLLIDLGCKVSYRIYSGRTIDTYCLSDQLTGTQLISQTVYCDSDILRGNSFGINTLDYEIFTGRISEVEEEIFSAKVSANAAENIQVGARNLIRNSITLVFDSYYWADIPNPESDVLYESEDNILYESEDGTLYTIEREG